LRIDKPHRGCPEATLRLTDGLRERIPAPAMVEATEEALQRARRLQALLAEAGVHSRAVRVEGQVGGGTLPLARPTSWACALDGAADVLLARLRTGDPAVLARIDEGRVLLDVRCVSEEALLTLARAVASADVVPGVGRALHYNQSPLPRRP
jgi:L-seryl-tRNA(Ser) seleniumtransferase